NNYFLLILAFHKECPWFYVGCKSYCSTATPYFNPVTEEIEANKYSCDTCEKNEITTSIRYKVQIKLADHTGNKLYNSFTNLHMNLVEQQVQFNSENEIPQELMDFFFFLTNGFGRKKNFLEKNYPQPSFKVVKLTDKPEVIQKFQDNVRVEVCMFQVAIHSDFPTSSSTCSAIQAENTSLEANNNDLPPFSLVTPSTKRQRIINKSKGTSKIAKGESGNKVGNIKKESTKSKH
ncbi:hypothetical protein HID58_062424, partial [Brassica napus]